MKIYIARDGNQHGPYSFEEVDSMLKSQAIKGDDLCWYKGCTDWIPLMQAPGFNTDPKPGVLASPRLVPQPPPVQTVTGEIPAPRGGYFIPAECPKCGGQLQLPSNREKIKCMYCGTDLLLRPIDGHTIHVTVEAPKINVQNYLDLAQTSSQAGNHEQAYTYYSAILEHDSTNVTAWIGKGVAAGWQSTLAKPRIEETRVCLRKALQFGLTEPQLRTLAADSGHRVAAAYYKLALDHRNQFTRSTTQHSVGLLDFLSNIAQDSAGNRQLTSEFVQRALDAIGLIEVAWSIQPGIAMGTDAVMMCNTLLSLKIIPDSTKQFCLRIRGTYENWMKQHSPRPIQAISQKKGSGRTIFQLVASLIIIVLAVCMIKDNLVASLGLIVVFGYGAWEAIHKLSK